MRTGNMDNVMLHVMTLEKEVNAFLQGDDAGMQKVAQQINGELVPYRSSAKMKHELEHNEDNPWSLANMDVPQTIQSRETYDRMVYQDLVDGGHNPALAMCATAGLMAHVGLLTSDGDGDEKKNFTKTMAKKVLDDLEECRVKFLHTNEVQLAGELEIAHIRKLAQEKVEELEKEIEDPEEEIEKIVQLCTSWSRDVRKRIRCIHDAGVRAIVCGRMVTGNVLQNYEAALLMAYSMGTHRLMKTGDYMTATDDLKNNDEESDNGSGYLGDRDLISGVFSNEAFVNLAQLSSNISGVEKKNWRDGDAEMSAELVDHIVRFMATANPACKRGSTAPFPMQQMVMVRVGAYAQSLQTAFSPPVEPYPDPLVNSVKALDKTLTDSKRMYGNDHEILISGVSEIEPLAKNHATEKKELVSVDNLAEWAKLKTEEAFNA